MNTVTNLRHVERSTPFGGKIIVLDTGATIGPEGEAMLQALHSRSVGGLKHHLNILASKGPEKFMSSFYVGYGHKSIGDCGTATVFIEGVSMLAAKAIQDWPLYSGQESSTRYIDFATQPFINPNFSETRDAGAEIMENWRKFYLLGLEEMKGYLAQKYPRQESENETDYSKAINARAFDVMRGFLPAGASTNLAWHMNLRQFADQIIRLRHHPLVEVQTIASATEDALREKFPSSFYHKRYDKTEDWNRGWMNHNYYLFSPDQRFSEFELTDDTVDRVLLEEYQYMLSTRPPKTDLPKELAGSGHLKFKFLLDFGSFRDLQRHRSISQRMPLLTSRHGFANWYLSELTDSLRLNAQQLLDEQVETIRSFYLTKESEQYFLPMGFNVPNIITGNICALVYLVELRATRFVHPTLRYRAQQIADELRRRFDTYGLAIHLDPEPDRFDIKRGTHDIVMR